jgi:translation initiation factor 2B subunit (eIF-2B alpha/beta/delta family)
MLLKKQIIEAVENMPNESSMEDLIERIIFIQKIEQGITDVQQNNVVNEDKIDYLIDEWSK